MTIFDPPEDIYVLGYVWELNAHSGGTREVFVSKYDLERRLAQLLKNEIRDRSKVVIHKLDPVTRTWVRVEVSWPTELEVNG